MFEVQVLRGGWETLAEFTTWEEGAKWAEKIDPKLPTRVAPQEGDGDVGRVRELLEDMYYDQRLDEMPFHELLTEAAKGILFALRQRGWSPEGEVNE